MTLDVHRCTNVKVTQCVIPSLESANTLKPSWRLADSSVGSMFQSLAVSLMNSTGSCYKWPPEHDWSEVSCALDSWWSRLRFGEHELILGPSLKGRLMHQTVSQLYSCISVSLILHCVKQNHKLWLCSRIPILLWCYSFRCRSTKTGINPTSRNETQGGKNRQANSCTCWHCIKSKMAPPEPVDTLTDWFPEKDILGWKYLCQRGGFFFFFFGRTAV